MTCPPSTSQTGVAPEDVRQVVRRRLRYGLSLPERAVRSTAGIVGGALRESATVLLPRAFRDARTYRGFVGQMLDFMAEDMGGVERASERKDAPVERYVARKTVGNFVELASLATVHVSPMLILALVSDIAYGSRAYLSEFAQELEQRGVIEDADSIRKADDLLDAVADASQRTATAFDTPPLSVDELRETIRQTRDSLSEVDVANVLPEVELRRLWERMGAAAQRQGVSPFDVSGLMTLGALDRVGSFSGGALSSVQAAGTLLDRHVIDHYRMVLADIEERGFYASLATASRPYAEAVWRNFAADRPTLTEEFLAKGGFKRTWRRARDWIRAPRRRKSASGCPRRPPDHGDSGASDIVET